MGLKDFMLSIDEKGIACRRELRVLYKNNATGIIEINEIMDVSINGNGGSSHIVLLGDIDGLYNEFDSSWQTFEFYEDKIVITNPNPKSTKDRYSVTISNI